LLALLLLPSAAFAQVETGQISGTVTDPQGAVISGATVTVTSKDTGSTRTSKTSGDGNYNVTNLQPGVYEVKVEGAGFGARTIPAKVSVGTATTVDATLDVGGSVASVDVVAGDSGVQVNTENQTLQTVVSEREIKELPTITRSPYSLVTLSGNVSPANSVGRGAGFAINGQREASTNILLDGSDNNDQFTASVGQDVPLDAVQEFSVLTSNFSAEYGRAGGGIVNVATKSGTNDFHGTVYEFNRVSRLASKDFSLNANYPPEGQSEIKKGVFARNQFGYSVGGPIIKDKLLFFSSTEWTRVRSQDTVSTFVPTPELIAASAPATQAFFANYSTDVPINGRVFTVGQINSGAANGPFRSLPAGLPAFGEILQSIPTDAGGGNPQNTYSTVNRADYNLTDKTTIYGRYALQSVDQFEGTNAFSPYSGFNTGSTNFNNNILASVTHVWSDNFVSQSKFVYNRLNNDQPLGSAPLGPTLYLTGTASYLPSGDIVALPGYLPFSPGSAIPFGGPQNLSQFYQDQTYTMGNHAIRFGGSYVRILDNRTFGAYENAVEALGNSLSTGLDNLVGGIYRTFQVAIDPQGHFPGEQFTLPATSPKFDRNNQYNEMAFYGNDTWKIRPRLTLNLGLRWDYFGVQHNKDQSLDSNFYPGTGATVEEQFANGKLLLAKDSPLGRLWKQDKNNFGPRLGIAWDVFGDGKTSLRGGYGISYERNFGNVTFNVIQNPPNYAVVSLAGGGAPIVSDNFGPFATGSGLVTLPRATVRGVDPNIDTAYVHFWSASLEHEFMGTYVVKAEYSASAGRDLYSISRRNNYASAVAYGLPFNPAAVIGVQPSNNSAYSNPQYGLINERANGGRSNYNGLTLSVETRAIANTGLQFEAKYTYSHALDNLSSTFAETPGDTAGSGNLGFLDPNNPDLDYASAAFDVRHRFVSSGIWEIPFAKKTEGAAKYALDGWQISYIYTAHTGSPFTEFDCSWGIVSCIRALNAGNIQTQGFANPRADSTTPNTFAFYDFTNQLGQAGTFTGGNPAATAYITSNIFGVPAGADYGPFPTNMIGRNTFRAPGVWNLDGQISKRINLTERYGLQFRAEFYNVFNHANLLLNNGTTDISSSDTVQAYRSGRRNIQLALKFTF